MSCYSGLQGLYKTSIRLTIRPFAASLEYARACEVFQGHFVRVTI